MSGVAAGLVTGGGGLKGSMAEALGRAAGALWMAWRAGAAVGVGLAVGVLAPGVEMVRAEVEMVGVEVEVVGLEVARPAEAVGDGVASMRAVAVVVSGGAVRGRALSVGFAADGGALVGAI